MASEGNFRSCALSTSLSRRQAASSNEYSVCRWRWTKSACDMESMLRFPPRLGKPRGRQFPLVPIWQRPGRERLILEARQLSLHENPRRSQKLVLRPIRRGSARSEMPVRTLPQIPSDVMMLVWLKPGGKTKTSPLRRQCGTNPQIAMTAVREKYDQN